MARQANPERRQGKYDQILDAARAVFQRKGFLNVKMKDIIDECQISRGGIYLYFSSVVEIYKAVVACREMGRFQEIRDAVEDNMDFYQLLDLYFSMQKNRLLNMEGSSMLRATYEYLFSHQEDTDQAFQTAQMEHVKESLQEILDLGVRQKAIRNEQIATIAENIMFTIEGLSVLALLGGLTPGRVDEQFRLIKSMLLERGALTGLGSTIPLRVLVTAGDTSERIDDVRKIVNPATGRLGSLVADMFAMTGSRVTYVCGPDARQPSQAMKNTYVAEDVRHLSDTLEMLLKKERYDCVVHSMAVSEYTLRTILTTGQLAENLSRHLKEAGAEADLEEVIRQSVAESGSPGPGKRIPADVEGMMLMMDPAPQINARIRELQPDTMLVGFKLLVDVDKKELVRSAMELLERDQCDFVLANDMEDVSEHEHKALLVAADGSYEELGTKQEIAQAIVKNAVQYWEEYADLKG